MRRLSCQAINQQASLPTFLLKCTSKPPCLHSYLNVQTVYGCMFQKKNGSIAPLAIGLKSVFSLVDINELEDQPPTSPATSPPTTPSRRCPAAPPSSVAIQGAKTLQVDQKGVSRFLVPLANVCPKLFQKVSGIWHIFQTSDHVDTSS